MNSLTFARVQDKLIRCQEEYRRRRMPNPSFYAKMAERKRLAKRLRNIRKVGNGPIYSIETKIGQKTVAEKANVKAAGILQGPFMELSEFDLDSLPDKFVIKPIVGSGADGVFLISKQNGQLIDLLNGKNYSNKLTNLYVEGLSKFSGVGFIAEQLVEFNNRPSLNWKVFSFYGEVGLIRQGDQGKPDKPYKLWSPDGRDLGPIDRLGFRYDPSLPAPRDIDKLLEAAKKISLCVKTPFVRVDLYESDDDVYLGEVTLRPSSLWKKKHFQRFTPEWDRKLGEMWEDAQVRLIQDIDDFYMP